MKKVWYGVLHNATLFKDMDAAFKASNKIKGDFSIEQK